MAIFIGVVIGAVIGYITNWLAIKMLFKPHTEKRIAGIKIPFTPGLIPKEKDRIAKNIGETVGKHLITEENMIEAMESTEVKKYLNEVLIKKVNEAKNSSKSIADIGEELLGYNYSNAKYIVKSKLNNYIIDKITNERMVENISTEIYEVLEKLLNEKPNTLFNKIPLENILTKAFRRESVNGQIREFLSEGFNSLEANEKRIKDILPKGFFQGIEVYAFNERDEISLYLRRLIRRDEVVSKIKNIIEKNVISNMNPLVSMFLSTESLYAKFTNIVDDYLLKEENKQEVSRILVNIVKGFSEKDINYILKGVPENSKNEILKDIEEKLVVKLNEEKTIQKIKDSIYEELDKFESLDKLLLYFDSEYNKKIHTILKVKVDEFLRKESLNKRIIDIINDSINLVEKKSLKDIVPDVDKKDLSIVFNNVERVINLFIKDEGGEFIKKLNISNIVEKQIKSFPVEYTEELILEIADKELKAITWLGALLGGIMGILTPILSRLLG